MASLAEKRMEDAEDHPIDQNTEIEARPEELRLLEALLFASAEPIDQAALAKRTVWSLAEARASLERLVGMTESEDWSCLDDFLLSYVVDPSQKATVFASSFAAALELVREGEMELNQKEAFAPLYFRKRPPQAMPAPDMTVE